MWSLRDRRRGSGSNIGRRNPYRDSNTARCFLVAAEAVWQLSFPLPCSPASFSPKSNKVHYQEEWPTALPFTARGLRGGHRSTSSARRRRGQRKERLRIVSTICAGQHTRAMTIACTCGVPHSQQQSHSAGGCGKQGRRRRASSAAAVPIVTAITTTVSRGGTPGRCKALLVARGGGRGGGEGKSWLGSVGSNDDSYDEFPEDFDYEYSSYDPDHLSEDDVVGCWPELEDEPGNDGEDATMVKRYAAAAAPGTMEERGSTGAGSKRGRRLPSGLGQLGGSRRSRGSPASALGANPTAPGLASSPPPTAFPSTPPSSSVIRNTPGGLALDPDFSTASPRTLLGAALGALAGLLGLKIWEALVHRRGSRRDDDGGREGRAVQAAAAMSEEEGLEEQQAKIEALEDQLAYLEDDRRRVAAAAKEARANRRKDDRELEEYVRTLEVHLDQLSREKKEMEASIVESVRAETAKVLQGAQEAAAAAAAEEVMRLKADLEATRALLEKVLEEKETVLREKETVLLEKEAALREKGTVLLEKEEAEQEKAATDTLLRTEQEHGAAFEKEIERLRESSAALNQRVLEAVAKAERAEAAWQEEAEKCRREMESALAEEKDRLRKQMEARIAAMRAGLKRRLQEARAERAGRSREGDERNTRTD